MDLRDPGTGVTRDSLTYYRDHRYQLADLRHITVRFPAFDDPHDPYLMVLTDSRGDRMLLSGTTTGYVGEGPNGSFEILVTEHVPIDLALAVTDAAKISFTRDHEGWCVEAYQPAHGGDTVDDVAKTIEDMRREHNHGRSR